MIPAVFLFTLGVIAFSESCHHFKDIERHRPINHGYALAFRLGIGSVMLAVMSVTHWLLAEDYRFLLLAPMGWAWWTAIFRFTLNNLREKDWRYLGKDAGYDCFWLYKTFTGPDRVILIASMLEIYYCDKPTFTIYLNTKDLVVCVDEYGAKVHRAGTLAYVFEALVFAASIAAYFLLA